MKLFRKKMERESMIILMTVLMLVVSVCFLMRVEQKQRTPHDWWAVYLQNPSIDAAAFVIENYGDEAIFTYEVLSGEEILADANVSVSAGEKKTISLIGLDPAHKKITISVMHGKDKRTLEKK